MTVGGPAAPSSEDPLLGRVLSDRYRILSKLGEGGMGVVYLAEHVVIEKKIALKVLFPDLTRRSDLVQRFMQEAKSASRIGHENVIDITDFGQSPEGYVFIAMEYLSGQDLGQVLKASGPMPWPRTQPIVLQIVKALRAAHEKGIVHRDMKPENVFVLPRDDGREFVKVLDFGIAKVLGLDEDAPRLTRTGMIFGTPEYMSPEQAQGQQVDHRVDIYAVGCIMYHMLTGEVPFKAESFMGILSKHMLEMPVPAAIRNPAIEPQVAAVVSRAMEKDPAKRFQTMHEFAGALVPLGYVRDLSGVISLATGLPTALGGTAMPLPNATQQIEGRASGPLAQANPEARRSETAIFSHDADEAPPLRKRSGSMIVIAVGAGAVLVLALLFFVFYLGGTGAIAPAPVTATGASATATPVGESPRLGATPTAAPVPAIATGSSTPAPGAAVSKKTKEGGSANRPHRTSREAIDSLTKAGARTPDELKNPFAAPSP